MSLISTSIDLQQGILFVESPRCKEGLQINFKSNTSNGSTGENFHIHGQR